MATHRRKNLSGGIDFGPGMCYLEYHKGNDEDTRLP